MSLDLMKFWVDEAVFSAAKAELVVAANNYDNVESTRIAQDLCENVLVVGSQTQQESFESLKNFTLDSF